MHIKGFEGTQKTFFSAGKMGNTRDRQLEVSKQSVCDSYEPAFSFAEKLEIEKETQNKMQELKETDEFAYNKLVMQQEIDEAHSIGKLSEIGEKYGRPVTKDGATFVFDKEHNKMCLGDMEHGHIINAGIMSNGYCFYFNRENIGQLAGMLDLFSPEDVNKIMTAIATDNVAENIKNEAEDEKAYGVKGANETRVD